MCKFRFRNWPYMAKAFAFLLFFVLMTTAATLLLFFPRILNPVQNDCQENMRQTLALAKSNIEYTLSKCQHESYLITGNDELNRYLLDTSSSSQLPNQSEIEGYLSAYTISDTAIRSCAVLCTDGRYYNAFHEFTASHEYLLDIARSRTPYTGSFYSWVYQVNESRKDIPPNLTLCGYIHNRTHVYRNEIIATFAVEYDVSLISSRFNRTVGSGYGQIELWIPGEKGYRVLGSGEIIEPEIASLVRSTAGEKNNPFEKSHKIYSCHTIANTDWLLVGILDTNEVNSMVISARKYYYTVLALEMAAALLISVLLAFQISKPLRQMTNFMKLVEAGEIDTRIPEDRSDEFGYLARSFNRMMERIQHLIHEVYEVRDSEKDAQIRMLTMQMNPHFLYNTLDAINWSIALGENDEASQMTTALGDILRYSVKGSDTVTLEEEVLQTENYLKIQKQRFGDMLQYRLEIPTDLLSARVIKFFLQPIVENAVIHGISGCGHAGEIIVSAKMDGDDLIAEVEDNGNGIDPSLIPVILEGTALQGGVSGIGISNVHKRIRLITGNNRYGVSIESGRGWTKVLLRMPGTL